MTYSMNVLLLIVLVTVSVPNVSSYSIVDYENDSHDESGNTYLMRKMSSNERKIVLLKNKQMMTLSTKDIIQQEEIEQDNNNNVKNEYTSTHRILQDAPVPAPVIGGGGTFEPSPIFVDDDGFTFEPSTGIPLGFATAPPLPAPLSSPTVSSPISSPIASAPVSTGSPISSPIASPASAPVPVPVPVPVLDPISTPIVAPSPIFVPVPVPALAPAQAPFAPVFVGDDGGKKKDKGKGKTDKKDKKGGMGGMSVNDGIGKGKSMSPKGKDNTVVTDPMIPGGGDGTMGGKKGGTKDDSDKKDGKKNKKGMKDKTIVTTASLLDMTEEEFLISFVNEKNNLNRRQRRQ